MPKIKGTVVRKAWPSVSIIQKNKKNVYLVDGRPSAGRRFFADKAKAVFYAEELGKLKSDGGDLALAMPAKLRQDALQAAEMLAPWGKERVRELALQLSSRKLRRWRGDWRLYYGYRGAPWISPVLICALMALERWLHEQLKVGEDISPALTMLLERSRSVGIAGVLVSIGKRNHEHFLGILDPLIGVPEFYV